MRYECLFSWLRILSSKAMHLTLTTISSKKTHWRQSRISCLISRMFSLKWFAKNYWGGLMLHCSHESTKAMISLVQEVWQYRSFNLNSENPVNGSHIAAQDWEMPIVCIVQSRWIWCQDSSQFVSIPVGATNEPSADVPIPDVSPHGHAPSGLMLVWVISVYQWWVNKLVDQVVSCKTSTQVELPERCLNEKIKRSTSSASKENRQSSMNKLQNISFGLAVQAGSSSNRQR